MSSLLITDCKALRGPDDVPADRPNCEWMNAHAKFPESLAAARTSPLLKQLRQQYFEVSELYRQWSVKSKLQDRAQIRAEHQALLDAAVAHDVEGAIALTTRHVQRMADLLPASRALEFT